MNTSKFPFIIDGFPRTGSTTLTSILNRHSEINCCMEPFHPKRYGGYFNTMAIEEDDLTSALDLIHLRWNGLKHVWEPPTGWPFTDHQHLNDELVQRAAIVINLRRRNLLRQFVSGYLCKRLKFWVGTREEFLGRLDRLYISPIPIEEARVMLAEMTLALKKRDRLLDTIEGAQYTLFYEDLFDSSEPDGARQFEILNLLIQQLGYPPFEEEAFQEICQEHLAPANYKWTDSDVYARIPGSRELDEALGSDATGRLFS